MLPRARPAGWAASARAAESRAATVTLTSAEQRLYDYVSAHRDGASYLMAVGSWEEASPYILATGQEVMPMGGFSGTVPSPTLAAVKHLVRTGQLRFFLISGTGTGAGIGGGQGPRRDDRHVGGVRLRGGPDGRLRGNRHDGDRRRGGGVTLRVHDGRLTRARPPRAATGNTPRAATQSRGWLT